MPDVFYIFLDKSYSQNTLTEFCFLFKQDKYISFIISIQARRNLEMVNSSFTQN